MAHRRGSSLFRLLVKDTNKKPQTFSGKNVSTQKTDGSLSLLGTESVADAAATTTAKTASDNSEATSETLPFEAIPGPKPSIPFIGTGWQYFPGGRYSLSNVYEACVDKYKRYGTIVKEEFQWRKPVVHLFDPKDFSTVGVNQGEAPVRPISEFLKHYRQNRPEKYDSVGLANSLGDEWMRLRKTLTPAFQHLSKLSGFSKDMNYICDDFVELLRYKRDQNTNTVCNLQDLLYRLSLEAVYALCLEERLGCLQGNLDPNSDASTMITSVKLLFEAFQDLYYGLPLWKYFETPAYKKLDKAESIMYDAASNRIQKIMEDLRSNKTNEANKPSGLLQTLLNLKGLTDKEIKVTIIDFISGGIFTVTNAFCFLLCHIAQNPDIQEKLYQELRKVVPEGNYLSENIQNLPYLRHCVRESFRLTPTIPTVTRILKKPITASGHDVPAGVPLFCNFTVACKHEKYFEQPDKYVPERWYDRRGIREKGAMMMPFGMGSRMCVGRKFAEMEMNTALAKIVLNYKLESTTDEVKCKQAFIIVPADPVSIVFHDRNK